MWRGPTGILCAQYRAIFEGEVQDTIGIHRDFLHHGIPQRRREFGDFLIAVHQLFCKGCEHFALRGAADAFSLDSLISISYTLITLCQRIVSGGVFLLIHCHAGVLCNGLFHQLGYHFHLIPQISSFGFQGLYIREEIHDDLDILRNEVPLIDKLVEGLEEFLLYDHLRQVRRSTMMPVLKLCIALPDHPAVFAVGVPHLAAVHLAAAAAENPSRKAARAIVLAARLPPALDLFLHHAEHLIGHNSRMAVLDVILRYLALVDLHFLGEEVRTEGLLQERVALVFLIGEDAQYSSRLPRFLASGRWDALRLKARLDSVGRLSLQEQPINPAHDLRFLGHDLWLAILTLAIPEEVLVRHGHLAVRKPLALAPGDVFGDVAAFLLRQ